jgi:hypothetical protein
VKLDLRNDNDFFKDVIKEKVLRTNKPLEAKALWMEFIAMGMAKSVEMIEREMG